MKIRKVISIILLISLLVGLFSFTLVSCKDKDPEPLKKAVIMVPGFGGSIFRDSDLNESIALVDDQNGNKKADGIIRIITSDKLKDMGLPAYADSILGCDENGNVINELPICDMNSHPDEIDSMLSMFRTIRKYINEKYSDYYDTIVWQFDYRKSMEITSLQLEEFINSNGYDKVIFITHSMGGPLVANYLCKEENRAKVELFIPVAAPFFGTYGAEGFVLTPMSGFSYAVSDSFNINIDVDVTAILSNMPSIYEMLPNIGYDYTNNHYYSMDGKIITADQAHSYMTILRDWFWKLDTEGNRIETKPMMNRLPSYASKFWIESEGVKTFVSDLVPVEYVALTGSTTTVGVNFTSAGGISYVRSQEGDSTVDLISATAGHGAEGENVHVVEGVNHMNIFEDPVTTVLKSIVDEYIPNLNMVSA